jgi:hypothetical protein
VSAVETYLRSEYGSSKETLCQLIEQAKLDPDLRSDLHKLRQFRNRWVHVSDPWDDDELIEEPAKFSNELETMSLFAVRVLRRVLYENPWT